VSGRQAMQDSVGVQHKLLPVQVQDGVWLIAHDLSWRRSHRYCWQRPVHCTNTAQVKTLTCHDDKTQSTPKSEQHFLNTNSKSNKSRHVSDRYREAYSEISIQVWHAQFIKQGLNEHTGNVTAQHEHGSHDVVFPGPDPVTSQ